MIREVVRGVSMLGLSFGALPWVCRRAARTQHSGGRAIDVLVEHAARMRRLAGIEVRVDGVEHVPTSGAFVVAPNQQSVADDLGTFEAIVPHIDVRVMAAEYARIPFVREGIELSGGVFLERGNRTATDAALDGLVAAARAGKRVAIWPEGRLSADGAVGRFKRGAFLVAIRAGVPIVPVAVDGGRAILRPGSLRMRPGTLRFRFGAPMPSTGLSEDDAVELAAQCQQVVTALHGTLTQPERERLP